MAPPNTHHRSVLITGCSSGIGLAIVERLLDEGWHVTGISRTRPVLDHPLFEFVAADLLENEKIGELLSPLGDFDALIHAAGLLRTGAISDMSLEDGETMWRIHVDSAARLIQQFGPGMPDGGRILLIGSRVSAGAASKSLYSATKAALNGLARSVAAELAPRRITVNVIAPGATDTPMLKDPARAGTAPVMSPMGRLVKPEEIAGLASFLLSDCAASLTGQQIVVCGGASL